MIWQLFRYYLLSSKILHVSKICLYLKYLSRNRTLFYADVTPPVFLSCPSDIRVSLSNTSSATLNWTIPIAVDNSKMKLVITVSPLGAIPPYTFHNSTLIVYTAIDAAGNKDECSFKVTLEG